MAKLWSVAGEAPALAASDPIFGISFRLLLLIAAVLELGVATICFFRQAIDALTAIAWLTAVFLTYRLGLWWIGWQKPCSCLGNLTDALRIPPQLADDIVKGLLAFMFIGSVSLLIMHHRRGPWIARYGFVDVPSRE